MLPEIGGLPHWLIAACLGVSLDLLLGEVSRWHPLVGFGNLVNRLEKILNPWRPDTTPAYPPAFRRGVLAWMLVVLPWFILACWVHDMAPLLTDTLLLYFALGARSLTEHARAIVRPLQTGNLDEARQRVSWLVSRETAALDATGVAGAGTESVLENGHDAIFGTLFWFAVGGGPAALLFRLANTLDAMWGYRTARFDAFGCFAARMDDVLGFPSARLTALTYALLGKTRLALDCWKTQAPQWGSPNAGPVMAAGAGSLGVTLGGPAMYHGNLEIRPQLGRGRPAEAADLVRAIQLIQRGMVLWLLVFMVWGVAGR